MKDKYVTYALFALFLLVVFFPDLSSAEYKDSSNWSFTMRRVVVSGSNLGSYHSLEEGVMTISGEIWSFGTETTATDEPEPILVEVYERKDWGVDRRVASVKLFPSAELDEKVEFVLSLGQQPASSKYYFHITKHSGQDDGWNIKGSGQIRVERAAGGNN